MLVPKILRNTLLAPYVVAAVCLGPVAASAAPDDQSAVGHEPRLVAQSSQEQFSDEQLQSFAAARQSVLEISQEWEERLNNTESQEELNSLQQAAQEEMVEAVQEAGISVNEYNMIVEATQTNPELRERVDDIMTQ